MRNRSAYLCLALMLLVGCAVTDRVTYTDQEGPVPDDIIHKIVNEETEKPWIMAHLGEPFAVDRVQTAGANPTTLYEVYTYRFSRTAVRSGHVMVFFKAGAREDTVEYLHIAFEKEQVQKAWLDKFARANLGTRLREERIKTMKVASKHTTVDATPVEEKPRFDWKVPILKKWFGGSNDNGKEQAKAQDKSQEKGEAVKQASADSEVKTEETMPPRSSGTEIETEKMMSGEGAADAL